MHRCYTNVFGLRRVGLPVDDDTRAGWVAGAVVREMLAMERKHVLSDILRDVKQAIIVLIWEIDWCFMWYCR